MALGVWSDFWKATVCFAPKVPSPVAEALIVAWRTCLVAEVVGTGLSTVPSKSSRWSRYTAL